MRVRGGEKSPRWRELLRWSFQKDDDEGLEIVGEATDPPTVHGGR